MACDETDALCGTDLVCDAEAANVCKIIATKPCDTAEDMCQTGSVCTGTTGDEGTCVSAILPAAEYN